MDRHFFHFPAAFHFSRPDRQNFLLVGYSIPAGIPVFDLDRLSFSSDFSLLLRDLGHEEENQHDGHENCDHGGGDFKRGKGLELALPKPDRSSGDSGSDRIGGE